jgi:hypothetical protein
MSPRLRRCFFNAALPAYFLNTPTKKFVLFLVFKFSLEVFNSSITSLSATTKREAIVIIAILKLKQETSRACVSANQVQVILP